MIAIPAPTPKSSGLDMTARRISGFGANFAARPGLSPSSHRCHADRPRQGPPGPRNALGGSFHPFHRPVDRDRQEHDPAALGARGDRPNTTGRPPCGTCLPATSKPTKSGALSRQGKDGRAEALGPECGDAYTYLAIERDTKLVLAYHVGRREPDDTAWFAGKLRVATAGRFQLTTDGFKPYCTAVPEAFSGNIDFAQLIKTYGKPAGRRSPTPATARAR